MPISVRMSAGRNVLKTHNRRQGRSFSPLQIRCRRGQFRPLSRLYFSRAVLRDHHPAELGSESHGLSGNP